MTINEQEILVDDLAEFEEQLYSLTERLGADDEIGRAWYIIHKRLQREREKEAIMKGED